MTSKALTTRHFFAASRDDEACLAHLFTVRFGQGFECPSCARAVELVSHQSRAGLFLPVVRLPPSSDRRDALRTDPDPFAALVLRDAPVHDDAARRLGEGRERQLGVTYKSAWRMAKLIREHMAMVDGEEPIGGPGTAVEVDETLVGGVKRGKHMRGSAGKVVVVGAMQRDGDIITAVVPNQRRATLQPFVKANVIPGGELHTDELQSYRGLHKDGYYHMTVNHGAHEYVGFRGATVNGIEGFWRHLKCSIQGTHVSVSAKYLGTYVKEFEYRFNRRNDPASMLPELLSTFGPWKPKRV